MKIFVYVTVVLFAGTLIGMCLGSGLAERPSVIWALPFAAIFVAGIILGVMPFAPR